MNHSKAIETIINDVYKKTKKIKSGKNATYIPELANVDPNIFAITFVGCDGTVINAGDHNTKIAIESISKVFTFAKAVEEFGTTTVSNKIGNMGSSLPFNSIIAATLSETHTINPFVNQGAIATTSLFYKKNTSSFERNILSNMDNFANKKLKVNNKLYLSEKNSNDTNYALAYILKSKDRFYGDVMDTVDVYTKQCSVMVSSKDLATMACVFAKGGVHPHSNKTILSSKTSEFVIRALTGEGLYEFSETWDNNVGPVPAKSGVGGGIFIILPGIGGLAIVSPPLDKFGNSVKGIKAGTKIVNKILRLHKRTTTFCKNNKERTKKSRKTKNNKKTRRNKK